MRVIYHPADPIDAQLAIDVLAASGINAHLQGGFLVGGIGELPAGEMLRVWVDDADIDQAKRLIAEWAAADPRADWPEQVSPALDNSWMRAWAGLGADGDGNTLKQRLLDAYSEPQRCYHTLQHLGECVAILEPQLSLAQRPCEVEMALWFHDAVHDPRGEDNEKKSADWAVRELQAANISRDATTRISKLIMATCHATSPSEADAKLLVDVDLSILGASSQRFEEYEEQVRQEYAWVPGIVFRRKRRSLLQELLAREHIYCTEYFRDTLETRARENLRRSVEQLRPWYQFWRSA